MSLKPGSQSHSGKQPEPEMDKTMAQLLIRHAKQSWDDTAGGFGQQNKFPMSPQLSNLIKIQASFPDEELATFVKLTLDQMAQRGLRDHIGGGFFRYTVDPAWDTPHFEKMLYDNAQLSDVQKKLELARYKLKQARQQRQIPVDNKVIAAWNGLLLTSMSKAVIKTGDKRYRQAATRLYQVLANKFWDGSDLRFKI